MMDAGDGSANGVGGRAARNVRVLPSSLSAVGTLGDDEANQLSPSDRGVLAGMRLRSAAETP